MGDTLIDDLKTMVQDDVPSWFAAAVGLVISTGPALFSAMAAADTDPIIAVPYVKTLLQLAMTMFDDLAAGKPETVAKENFDQGVADMLSLLKFGATS